MPQKRKGARLWLQPANGRESAIWVIRDGAFKQRTGFRAEETGRAEQALADYIARKYQTPRTRREPHDITVADVVAIYVSDVVESHSRPRETAARLRRILNYFGNLTLAEVNRASCKNYAVYRGKIGAVRRELADLRAAIRHHWSEGLCTSQTPIILPPKTTHARDRWLTRSEAARILWVAWRYREIQKGHSTGRHSLRHLARFTLIGLYTGTRAGAICAASYERSIGRGWVDLNSGVFHRRGYLQRETKKRQPPVRLPPRLLTHLRRWHAMTPASPHVVEWNGAPVRRINKAFRSACRLAGLGHDVVPHTLRHTCATWLAQRGVPIHEICGFLGMTQEMFERVYGHHHPDFQAQAVNAFGPADRLRTNSVSRT